MLASFGFLAMSSSRSCKKLWSVNYDWIRKANTTYDFSKQRLEPSMIFFRIFIDFAELGTSSR